MNLFSVIIPKGSPEPQILELNRKHVENFPTNHYICCNMQGVENNFWTGLPDCCWFVDETRGDGDMGVACVWSTAANGGALHT